MNILRLLPILVAVAVVSLSPGCTKKKDLILGKWEDVSSNNFMEFTKDKVIVTPTPGTTIVGAWEWVDEKYDRILVTVTGPRGSLVMPLENIEIKGDTATMTTPSFGGTVSTLKRVKD